MTPSTQRLLSRLSKVLKVPFSKLAVDKVQYVPQGAWSVTSSGICGLGTGPLNPCLALSLHCPRTKHIGMIHLDHCSTLADLGALFREFRFTCNPHGRMVASDWEVSYFTRSVPDSVPNHAAFRGCVPCFLPRQIAYACDIIARVSPHTPRLRFRIPKMSHFQHDNLDFLVPRVHECLVQWSHETPDNRAAFHAWAHQTKYLESYGGETVDLMALWQRLGIHPIAVLVAVIAPKNALLTRKAPYAMKAFEASFMSMLAHQNPEDFDMPMFSSAFSEEDLKTHHLKQETRRKAFLHDLLPPPKGAFPNVTMNDIGTALAKTTVYDFCCAIARDDNHSLEKKKPLSPMFWVRV